MVRGGVRAVFRTNGEKTVEGNVWEEGEKRGVDGFGIPPGGKV